MKKIVFSLIFCLSLNANLMQQEIKHVVVVMLENRSFDNVLGWAYEENAPLNFIPSTETEPYKGLDINTLHLYTNELIGSTGQFYFSSTPIKGPYSVRNDCLLNSPKFDPNEPFQNVITQIYGLSGKGLPLMKGFLQDYASLWDERDWNAYKDDICAVMESYTDKELPVMYSLARNYGVSDSWFSSIPSQTNPNRAYSLCGTSQGTIVNGFLEKNWYTVDTIWNRIQDLIPSTTWTLFWQADFLPGIYTGPYSVNIFEGLTRIDNIDSHISKIDQFHALAREGNLPQFSFIEPQWTTSLNLSPKEKDDADKLTNREEAVIGLQGNDMHPPGDVRPTENFLANLYSSLIANEEAWKHTLLIITFDEHGGIFDHVPPPSAIAPDDNFQNGFTFDRFGVRVPALFISPLIEKSTVIRSGQGTPFDHTSLIATVLTWLGVDRPNWNMGLRTASAPTFDTVITLDAPRTDALSGGTDTVYLGDPIYLMDPQGRYLSQTERSCWQFATVGGQKVFHKFLSGGGKLTHGSFVLIETEDVKMGSQNILGSFIAYSDCEYGSNRHEPGQWWTVKSVDHPELGYEIQYGDLIYLENHRFLDTREIVLGRLTPYESFFGTFLKTVPITKPEAATAYWKILKGE